MKKMTALILAAVLAAGCLSACGGSSSQGTSTSTSASTSTSTSTQASASTSAAEPAKDGESYRIIEENFGDEQYGIAFKKGNNDIALAVQEQLEAMIKDGAAAKISDKWFGEDIMLTGTDYPDASVEQAGDGSLDAVKAKGKFVLGLDASFPPMGYTDTNGEIVGFDIDLAKEVCDRLGVELVCQPINWDMKEQELDSGNIDCIWNGMTITDERVSTMALIKPYIQNAQIVLVPMDSDIKTKADMAGKNIGVQKGSSAVDAVESEPEVMATFKDLVSYEDNVAAISDMDNGRLDAVVLDEIVARYIISQK